MTKEKSNPFCLRGRVCVITGGVGLLGKAFGEAVVLAGATVILLDVNKELGQKAVKEINKKIKFADVSFQYCDITNEAEILKVRDSIIKKYKRIDALVNNAYPRNKNYGQKFEEKTHADFCENVDANLGGYFLAAKVFSEVMKRQEFGTIINLGSIYGLAAPRFEIYKGTTMTVPVEYAAIKGGIINLTRYLASYLGEYNIRVNCLSPGGVWDNQPESLVKRYSKKVILGSRMARPDDLTGVLLFLLSDAAKYITGQNIIVDGGWTL